MSDINQRKKVYRVTVTIDSTSERAFDQLTSNNLSKRVKKELEMISSNKICRGSRLSDIKK